MSDFDLVKYKCVLFDWDNTLVDTLPVLKNAHNYVRKHFGLPVFQDSDFEEIMRFSTKDAYPDLYGDRAEEGIDVLLQFMQDNHLQGFTILESAEDFVKALHKLGFKLGVISNKRPQFLYAEVGHSKMRPYFDVILGSGEADQDKPSGAPLDLACQKLGISDKSQCLYVGDSETDVLAARDANISMIYIKNNGHSNIDFSQYSHIVIQENSTKSLFSRLNTYF